MPKVIRLTDANRASMRDQTGNVVGWVTLDRDTNTMTITGFSKIQACLNVASEHGGFVIVDVDADQARPHLVVVGSLDVAAERREA